jgi:hypothetical protein
MTAQNEMTQITLLDNANEVKFFGKVVESHKVSFIDEMRSGGVSITSTSYQDIHGKFYGSLGIHYLNEHNYVESETYRIFTSDTDLREEFNRVLVDKRHLCRCGFEEITHY